MDAMTQRHWTHRIGCRSIVLVTTTKSSLGKRIANAIASQSNDIARALTGAAAASYPHGATYLPTQNLISTRNA